MPIKRIIKQFEERKKKEKRRNEVGRVNEKEEGQIKRQQNREKHRTNKVFFFVCFFYVK